MNGRPAHEPRTTHFPLRAVSWLAWLSCRLLAGPVGYAGSRGMQEQALYSMRGRRGHQGPHRGQGSRQVALGLDAQVICIPMRFCRRLRVATHAHTHTGPGQDPGGGQPKAPHGGRFIHAAPLPRRATLPTAARSTYSSTSSCTHMRQTALSGFTAFCSPAVYLSVCLSVSPSVCL